MSSFFIGVYRFFRSNRIIFYLFLLLSVLFIILFASRIILEEDISGVVRNPGDSSLFNSVAGNLKIPDKLIVNICLSDSNQKAVPEDLSRFGQKFLDSVSARFDTSCISSVNGKISDTLVSFLLGYVYEHLPFYLDERDYERIAELTGSDSVRAITGKNYRALVSPAGLITRNMILKDPLGIGFIALNKLRSLQAGENYVISNGFIFTKDLKNLLIFITPANPPNETNKNAKLVSGIDDILLQLGRESGMKVRGSCFGSIVVAAGNARQLKQDILVTITVALILIVLFIGFYFRSIKIPLFGFLPALFGGGLALAALYLIKGHVSAISLGIGSVILGLIIDYALYFINNFRKHGDPERTLKELSLTIIICSVTSTGAFLCLLFLRSSVLHDLRWFAALSVTGAALFALVILPQFLRASDSKRWKDPGFPFVDRISAIQYEKSSWLVISLLIIGIASIFFSRKVDFENDMMALNFSPPKVREAEKEINRITGVSLKNVYIVSTGKTLQAALASQEKVQALLGDLQEDRLIKTVSGIGNSLLSDSSQERRIRMWNDFWTPGRKNELRENLIASGKEFRFRESAFDPFYALLDKKYMPLNEEEMKNARTFFGKDWISDVKGFSMVYTVAKSRQEDIREVSGKLAGIPGVVVFDRQSLANRFVENVKHDFELLVKLSMVFVTLLLWFALGRIELTVITALPMFFSWLVTLGFMGITGIKFNIFNIIISSFIFGLGVDYSIIMTRSLQQRFKYGHADTDNQKIAVFISSLTTIFGVGALFFARHPALNSIALISIAGVGMVVISSYVFQPLLMNWFFFSRLNKRTFPVTARIFIKTFITWGNIVMIGIVMMVTGIVFTWLVPVKRDRKEIWFHALFSKLCRAYIAVTFPFSRKLINTHGEDFKKPAVIISNHQSLIETPAFLRLYPKILILTNDWVWNSLLFGPVARFASYYNVENGIDAILDKLRAKVAEGYSILVFPEGHRSTDHRIQRFHRGAFYMAEKLQLDILPVVVYGSGEFLPRGAFWGRPNALYMEIHERIAHDDMRFGSTYSERTRKFRHFYRDLYHDFKEEYGTTAYYRRFVILNYVCKGPMLEWYIRVKMKLASNYEQFNKLIPKRGSIIDFGCGYGFITYILGLTGDERVITGIDHDQEKIEVAKNVFLKNDRINFICEDISGFTFGPQDGFLLGDVLHYMKEEVQEVLLKRCMQNLNPGGTILIRDADRSKLKQHAGTRLTEYFSTRLLGFNKTMESKELHFTSLEQIKKIADEHRMKVEVVTEAKRTSNFLIIIRHSA